LFLLASSSLGCSGSRSLCALKLLLSSLFFLDPLLLGDRSQLLLSTRLQLGFLPLLLNSLLLEILLVSFTFLLLALFLLNLTLACQLFN